MLRNNTAKILQKDRFTIITKTVPGADSKNIEDQLGRIV